MIRSRRKRWLAVSAGHGDGGSFNTFVGPTARYWEFQLIGTGQQNTSGIAQFIPSFRNGNTGTLSVSETGSGSVANLSDGLQTTNWTTTAGYTSAYIRVDLGVGNDDTLSSFSMQQTDGVDAVDAHPAAMRIRYSDTGFGDAEEMVDYCVVLTNVSATSSDLVEYSINSDCQNQVDYFSQTGGQIRWGIICNTPSAAASIADVNWQDSGGTNIGTVSSHITTSNITMANLYDDNSATESSFDSQAHPQMFTTEFTSAISVQLLELVGSATAANSWVDIAIVAGPADGNLQVITEVELTWSSPGEVIVIDPKVPKAVQTSLVLSYLPGGWDGVGGTWTDAANIDATNRNLTASTTGKRMIPGTSPTRLFADQRPYLGGSAERQLWSTWGGGPYITVNGWAIIVSRPTATWDGHAGGSGSNLDRRHILSIDPNGGPATYDLDLAGQAGETGFWIGWDDLHFNGRRAVYRGPTEGWTTQTYPTIEELGNTESNTYIAMMAGVNTATYDTESVTIGVDTTASSGSGAIVNYGALFCVNMTNIEKKGNWTQFQKYVKRVIDELNAS